MKKYPFTSMLVLAALLLLIACTPETQEGSSSKAAGTPAMVDSVAVETVGGHQYAVVKGFYPDPCTRISQVDQSITGSNFQISLTTGRPDDLICAQMLEAYEVSILLETGGLAPGEYTLVVSDLETSFRIGP